MGTFIMGVLAGVIPAATWDGLCHVFEHPRVRKAAKCVAAPPLHKPLVCPSEASES